MGNSEREHTNHALLNRLIVDYGTVVLREIFDSRRPPGELKDYLASHAFQASLVKLHGAGYISLAVRRRLQTRPFPKSSDDLDITLLAALLRTTCSLMPPHFREWNDNQKWDETREVNIARLRDYKNRFVSHVTSASLDDATFEEHWGKISGTIIALADEGEKERYASAISQLKSSQRFVEVKQKLQHLEEMMKSHEVKTSQAFRELNEMLTGNQQ